MGRFSGVLALAAALALALVASVDAAAVPAWGAAAGRSLRRSPIARAALSPSHLSLVALRGGAASTEGIPLLAGASTTQDEGKVFLKLSINYGVDGGSIVAVGPSSAFGNGDIHKGLSLSLQLVALPHVG